MTKLSPEREQSRRNDICLAAWSLIERHGVDGTSTDAIARAAKVSVGTLYRYYPTKSDLVLEVFQRAFEAFRLIANAEFEQKPLSSPRILLADILWHVDQFEAKHKVRISSLLALSFVEAPRNEQLKRELDVFYVGFRHLLISVSQATHGQTHSAEVCIRVGGQSLEMTIGALASRYLAKSTL